ncbi:isochorismatase family protein [Thalassomonas sp. RHCl1]|uniref:isochorismatase family protein n=1 Tax=Thalassomonas sp. RHCl1 TaxID=2995320 RepID=UPI00248CAF0E|nr:isochorismatase family protein [Thalassomonas sp. RHCl1]
MLEKENCGLILVDIQGSLARMVQHSELFLANTKKLLQCSKLLAMPVIWLEQNPKGLGATVPEIVELMKGADAIEKFHFNAMCEPQVNKAIKATGRQEWLVAGIEAHICVYQSVLGLLNEGFKVDVVSDCISSRLQSNIDLALIKMRDSGARLTSLEMCIFELMKTSKIENFRKILSIIK